MSKHLLKLIPSKIRITRNATYEVFWYDNFPHDPKQVGECRKDPPQILLKKNQSDTETFKTFIHELLHAVNFEMENLNLTERQTLLLEEGLFRVLKLNNIIK